MTELLPLFPLGIVVFPGEVLNLHIFEPRYKQLIMEAHSLGINFGIASFFEGKPMNYATVVELVVIAAVYPDGKMDITLKGLHVCEIEKFYHIVPDKLYPGGDVHHLPFFDNFDIDINEIIIGLLLKLYKVMNIENIILPVSLEFRTSFIGHKVGFTTEQELEFMLINNERQRAEYMLAHLEVFVPRVLNIELLRKKAELNGHFQEHDSPFL